MTGDAAATGDAAVTAPDGDTGVAVVTGGGTGIGRAITLALAETRTVVVTYRRSSAEAAETVELVRARGGTAFAMPADVADDAQVRRLADRVRTDVGGVDVLVNNAGTTHPVEHADLDGLTDAVWQDILGANLLGAFHCCRAFAPALRAERGAVVNIASISGFRAGGSSIAYGVSKAALLQLTRNLAVALAPEVRVNAVAPGTVEDTRWQPGLHGAEEFARRAAREREAVPLRRTARPEHVAQAVLGLLGMELVTGEALILDGGKHVTY